MVKSQSMKNKILKKLLLIEFLKKVLKHEFNKRR